MQADQKGNKPDNKSPSKKSKDDKKSKWFFNKNTHNLIAIFFFVSLIEKMVLSLGLSLSM